MAFRVLSEKELALLSEKERQIYETEYKEYSERKAFVERLEYLDGVKFPKVKPKKPSIKRIKSPDISVKMNEPFRAVQPESLRDGKLFSRTSGKQFTPPVIGDAKVTGIPAVTLPKAEKRRNVEEYRLKPFTAFDFSRASKQNETVLHDVSAAHISEAKVSALPGVSIVSAAGVSADIPEYSVTEPVKVPVCDAGGFGAVSIPDTEVKLPAGVVVPSDGISVNERAVPDYKCTEMPEIRIAEASVSKVETGGQYKAEVPGVVTAKADISKVRTGGQFRAEVPGVVSAKADVSNVRTGGQFRAEVPGVVTAKADVPNVRTGGQFRAEVPGVVTAKADVSNVRTGGQFKAEVPGVVTAKADVSKVRTGGQFKAEVPGVVTAKADVSNVRTGGQYKAEVPGVVTAKADVPKVRTGGQFKAEVPGVVTAKADVPKVRTGGQFKAEVPGVVAAKADVPKVRTGGQFKAEVPGVVTAKADISKVRTGEQFKAEVPGVVTAKADVPKVRTGEQFKAEVPGTFVAEVPKIDFKLPKVRKKKAVTAVQPEAPAISCEIKEYVPEPVKEITVPVVGELPQLNSETNIDTKQPFVAKPVQINVKIDLPVQKAAEVKPFIAKADVPDGSETIRTILGLLR
ncbi:MAG: hypothetical protein K5884_04395 [Ruminococcus sp.]|nr:hypothetical protein [Ruminococcus sp.]